VPERPKGTGCKPVGSAYGGSNPPAPTAVAETVDEVPESSAEDGETKDEEAPSVTELLVRLGRDVSVLVFCEAQLAASRNLPEVRQAARDVAGAVIAALAFLTAFVFANVAALQGLTTVVSPWLAALILCLAWLAVGVALAIALMVRAGQVTGWKWWRVFRAGKEESLEDLERARVDAEQAVRETLALLAPAMTVEIASASIGVAGDMADDFVETGEDLLESSEEFVEEFVEDIPGGGVVSQVWGIVLIPGRFGIRVATTVLGRSESGE
jgi:Putative Actinobacterial Holin-X, holin superfamily III